MMSRGLLFLCLAFQVYNPMGLAAAPPPPAPATAAATGGDRCSRPAEVVFLVDTSRSIYPLDFPHELSFVQQMIGQFDVSPNTTRVAVISFSNGYREEFGLDTYQSAAAMQIAVAKIPFTAGDTTDTGDAIQHARDVILRQARPGVPRIIICITDGRSTIRATTVQEAEEAHQEGIIVFAIGVGLRVDARELVQIATQNSQEFVHMVDNFPGLSSISSLLALQACQAAVATTSTVTVATTSTGNPQNDQQQAQQACGGKPADVVFVLDRSNSVYINDFRQQLTVVQDIVRTMDIGADKTQVAAVSFSSNVTVEFYLNDFSTKDNVIARLAKVQYTGGVTETGQALSMVHDAVLSPQHGGRRNVTRVVVVITDGLSQDMRFTASAAGLLKTDGVHVFAIGVGPNVDRQELENIVSQPYADFLFEVSGYQALSSIQYLLATRACQAKP